MLSISDDGAVRSSRELILRKDGYEIVSVSSDDLLGISEIRSFDVALMCYSVTQDRAITIVDRLRRYNPRSGCCGSTHASTSSIPSTTLTRKSGRSRRSSQSSENAAGQELFQRSRPGEACGPRRALRALLQHSGGRTPAHRSCQCVSVAKAVCTLSPHLRRYGERRKITRVQGPRHWKELFHFPGLAVILTRLRAPSLALS